MAQFAILIHAPAPGDWMEAPADELAAHEAYAKQITDLGGDIVAAYALQASTTGKSVRGRDEQIIKDGALLDADEVLGGITIIEARDLDHALEIAKLCPATWRGGVEVRPLLG